MIHKGSALISVADMKNCADFKMFFNNKAANKFRSGMNMMYDKNIRTYNKASNIKNKMDNSSIKVWIAAGVIICIIIMIFIGIWINYKNIKDKNNITNYDEDINAGHNNYNTGTENNIDVGIEDINTDGKGVAAKNYENDSDNIKKTVENATDRAGMTGNSQMQEFYLIIENYRINVYYNEDRQLYDIADINVSELPTDIKQNLEQGIVIKGEQELYDFLQTYSS